MVLELHQRPQATPPACLFLMGVGKPLLASDFSHGAVPMTYQDVLDALVWIDEHFHLIRPLRDEMPSIDFILDRARAAVTR